MKRKKQTLEEEAHPDQEPTIKRSRSRLPAKSIEEDAVQNVHASGRSSLSKQEESHIQGDLDIEASDHPDSDVLEEEGGQESSENGESEAELTNITPVKQTPRGLKGNGIIHEHLMNATPTKGLLNKKLFSTPVKTNRASEINETPRIERNADHSARRKSTRTLIERTILGNTSDNDEEEDDIAQHIYDSGEEEDTEGIEVADQPLEEIATPSKRGRKKGSKGRKGSLTPPPDLDSHEKYFFQNRGGRAKTSNNDLSSLALLDHEEYFSRSRNIVDPHAEDIKFLEQLHAHSFNQWQFELSQDFNICVFGYGSKRALLMEFADHIHRSQTQDLNAKIVVVNGYVNNLTVRDILNTVASAIAERGHKLGPQPADMLENIVALLDEDKSQHVTLIVHSIDRVPLRRLTTQTILSRLSAHPQVHLVASADHPSFPLLWDSSLRSTYNFVFHDCTTFHPYSAELDVVDEVHDLLGRSGRRVGGKEGVSFVLKSLPENAKNLFKVLIGEQLIAMDENSAGLADEDDDEDSGQQAISIRRSEIGVEYRVLYQKAVEEFICSNEMNFRTLLKEYEKVYQLCSISANIM
jgi:origin recognition complex subunit 2